MQSIDPVSLEEAEIEEKVGYYGEQLALRIVQLGLATSWAVLDDAATGWWELEPGERVVWILTFGNPARTGARHHSKPLDSLCSLPVSLGSGATLADAPDWFQRGIEAASLAPTSLGQQPFVFTLEDPQINTTRNTNIADSSSTTANSADSAGSAISVGSVGSAGSTTPASSIGSAVPIGSIAASATLPSTVSAHVTLGLFAHVGLGCAKRNFEIGAGTDNFKWAQ